MKPYTFVSLAAIVVGLVSAHPNTDRLKTRDPNPDDIDPQTSPTDLVKRKDCEGEECVWYYKDQGCTKGLSLGSYKPDCSGACFQYDSFGSIGVKGAEGLFYTQVKTRCVAYSDENCQDQIADSGDHKEGYCLENVGRGRSMKCYWGC